MYELEYINNNQTFAPTPNWLMERTEISDSAKLLYARLIQYRGKDNLIFPKRETLAKNLGKNIRAIDRYIRELIKHNLIAIKQMGCNRSNEYTPLTHIWMKNGQTYKPKESPRSECTKMSTPECTKMDTPYKDEKITLKDNIIQSETNELIDQNSPKKENLREKFENWWKAYPRKQNKQKAYTHFCAALKHIDFETLICKARSYARMREKITEVKPDQVFYTKMPHNWLGEFAWEDHYGRFEAEPRVFKEAVCTQEKTVIPETIEITSLREKIQQNLGDAIYGSWFKKSKLDIQDKNLIIETATRFHSQYIKTHFGADILRILEGQISFVETYQQKLVA